MFSIGVCSMTHLVPFACVFSHVRGRRADDGDADCGGECLEAAKRTEGSTIPPLYIWLLASTDGVCVCMDTRGCVFSLYEYIWHVIITM